MLSSQYPNNELLANLASGTLVRAFKGAGHPLSLALVVEVVGGGQKLLCVLEGNPIPAVSAIGVQSLGAVLSGDYVIEPSNVASTAIYKPGQLLVNEQGAYLIGYNTLANQECAIELPSAAFRSAPVNSARPIYFDQWALYAVDASGNKHAVFNYQRPQP
ncbi:hypothetical protein [Luteimonas sp. gir]|uniref:hypothetical protein n=1 Tax=Luteimonas sp. gir TaxID=3127960 RepID=UPI003075DB27